MKIDELEESLTDAKKDVLLKPFTSMKVGGKASLFYEASSQDELKNAVLLAWRKEVPVLILGGATNVVISDLGFPQIRASS
jgi:UDP-N-acetylmuramate dehydrogenase